MEHQNPWSRPHTDLLFLRTTPSSSPLHLHPHCLKQQQRHLRRAAGQQQVSTHVKGKVPDLVTCLTLAASHLIIVCLLSRHKVSPTDAPVTSVPINWWWTLEPGQTPSTPTWHYHLLLGILGQSQSQCRTPLMLLLLRAQGLVCKGGGRRRGDINLIICWDSMTRHWRRWVKWCWGTPLKGKVVTNSWWPSGDGEFYPPSPGQSCSR